MMKLAFLSFSKTEQGFHGYQSKKNLRRSADLRSKYENTQKLAGIVISSVKFVYFRLLSREDIH